MSITAMKQALEALERIEHPDQSDVIEVLRQAIAEAEKQEPVAFITNKRQRMNVEIKPIAFVWMPTTTDWEIPLYTHPQPKQEPLRDELKIAIRNLGQISAHGIGKQK